MTAPVAEATAPTLNLPLAEAVLEQITAHPEMHDQNCYGIRRACRTTQCIAGWAAVLSPDAEAIWSESLIAKGTDVLEGVRLFSGGHAFIREVSTAASELLGLTEGEADDLFFNFDDGDAVAYLRQLIAAAKQATTPRSMGGELNQSRRCASGDHDNCRGQWTSYPDKGGPCECLHHRQATS